MEITYYPRKTWYCLLTLALACLSSCNLTGQNTRLERLVKETNDLYLYPMAPGILLSPYELIEHNRSRTIKHIDMVEAMDVIFDSKTKSDTTPVIVLDNQTIVQKPDERFNSRTTIYHKDGRIHKTVRGRHLQDLYVQDKNGFLIQHGRGGELKKAIRKGRVFEWRNVKLDRLEYVTSFDDQDRLTSMKMLGHYFGRNFEYVLEQYEWEERRLLSKTSVKQYKNGKADSTIMKLEYDSLGIILKSIVKGPNNSRWYTTDYTVAIDSLDGPNISISIHQGNYKLLAVTYDHFDNWIKMERPARIIRRNIKYRKKRRKE